MVLTISMAEAQACYRRRVTMNRLNELGNSIEPIQISSYGPSQRSSVTTVPGQTKQLFSVRFIYRNVGAFLPVGGVGASGGRYEEVAPPFREAC